VTNSPLVLGQYQPEVSALEGDILRLIRDAGTISRAELARRSGMSRPVVTARLAELTRKGLLQEVGVGSSTGGRPPTMVRFAREAGFVIGIDLGATSVDVAITDLSARTVARVATDLDVQDGPTKILGLICDLVDGLLDDGRPGIADIRGIGIGLPGPVEFWSGTAVSPPIMPGWDRFPVRSFLAEKYHRPVFVDNDANVMALGEGSAGVGVDVPDFLFVKIGSGIGCGIICGGSVYRGQNGSAGDIGHIAVRGATVTCRCGNIGCLEAIAGGRALGLAARELALAGNSPELAATLASNGTLSAEDLGSAITRGELGAVDLVRTAASAIGEVLASLVNFYNPSLVAVGGGVANIGDLLLAAIRESIYRRSTPLATRDLVVTKSVLGTEAGITGAAAMVLAQLYRLLPMGHG
jgi:glucokinase-like ROK family protein